MSESYACNFDVLDQEVICSNVSTVRPGPCSEELQLVDIDGVDRNEPIEIFIRADVAGKIYTEKRHLLSNRLFAMHTLLGWTLMGRITTAANEKSSTMVVTSLLSTIDKPISDLWSLDALGIRDPEKIKTEIADENRILNNFLEFVSVQDDGRYEFKLPWLEEPPPLPTKLKVAQKRINNLTEKLSTSGHRISYQQLLDEWEEQGVIEKVENAELDQGHYLPHQRKPSSQELNL